MLAHRNEEIRFEHGSKQNKIVCEVPIDVKYILELVGKVDTITINNINIKLKREKRNIDYSANYRTLKVFKNSGTQCINCRCEGTKFFICSELQNGEYKYFLNLFSYVGITKNGLSKYRLMTKDHIIAIANGGSKKSLSNLQTMCITCNNEKGSKNYVNI